MKSYTKIKSNATINNRGYLVLIFLAIIIFSLIAVFGLSLITGNKDQTNIGNSLASATEPADINNDNKVDVFDLSILLSKWNTNDSLSDLNKDGSVNVFDLSILLSKWGVVSVSSKPNATNTGVPAGVNLRAIATAYPDSVTKGYTVNSQGRITITKDGGVYDSVIFPAGVIVKAKNIVIKNSLIEGGRSSFANMPPEPTSWDQCRQIYLSGASAGSPQIVDANSSLVSNLLIEDSEIRVRTNDYSIYINGMMGHDATLRRVNINGAVDGLGIWKGSTTATYANFILEDSFIHSLYKGQWSPGNYNIDPTTGQRAYCGYDAAHPEGTHNDGIQMHGGDNVTISRNNIDVKPINAPQSNAGIMANAASSLIIENNHFRYGVCSINLVSGLGLPVTVQNNTFYGNNGSGGTALQNDNGCAIIRPSASGYTFSNNLWENGNAIRLYP
jgi:hypothetical protein